MINSICSKFLDDPRSFYHSHASGVGNLYITSGMVSRKDISTGLNIGVTYCDSSNLFKHDIGLQFNDIIIQLGFIAGDLGIGLEDLHNSILDVRVFIVNLKHNFQAFNSAYGEWIGDRESYPSRTTIGVYDLPSNVVLEMAFTLDVN